MIKWIGQHIWDFVSRFRNDVYLESVSTDTIVSGGNLGLDSNNKIVKATVSGGVSLGNDGNDRVVTATGGGALHGEENLTWNNLQLGLEYSGADGPTMLLTKTGDNATAPIINFVAQRAANGGAANNDDDYLGYTRYWGYNNAGTPEAIKFAEIRAQISERDDGVEEGTLALLVQARGALRTGFSCVGNGSAIVDTTIGTGATSVATITGDAYVTSNIQLGHASDTTLARSAAGKVTIEGNEIALVNTTARQIVSLRTDDAYIMYLGSVNRWYQANRVFTSIGVYSTLDGQAVTDSSAMTSTSYVAVRPCTVHSVVIAWYPNNTADVEFEILKVPLVDNSTSNVTYAKMTHTDHNASYTANTNYVKTFTITGGNTLTAGQGFALAMRRTSGAATYMVGQIYAEIEITG